MPYILPDVSETMSEQRVKNIIVSMTTLYLLSCSRTCAFCHKYTVNFLLPDVSNKKTNAMQIYTCEREGERERAYIYIYIVCIYKCVRMYTCKHIYVNKIHIQILFESSRRNTSTRNTCTVLASPSIQCPLLVGACNRKNDCSLLKSCEAGARIQKVP